MKVKCYTNSKFAILLCTFIHAAILDPDYCRINVFKRPLGLYFTRKESVALSNSVTLPDLVC